MASRVRRLETDTETPNRIHHTTARGARYRLACLQITATTYNNIDASLLRVHHAQKRLDRVGFALADVRKYPLSQSAKLWLSNRSTDAANNKNETGEWLIYLHDTNVASDIGAEVATVPSNQRRQDQPRIATVGGSLRKQRNKLVRVSYQQPSFFLNNQAHTKTETDKGRKEEAKTRHRGEKRKTTPATRNDAADRDCVCVPFRRRSSPCCRGRFSSPAGRSLE